MLRTTINVNGVEYRLAQGRDVDEVKRASVAAVRANGDLVDVVVVGNRLVSILMSPGVPITFESIEVDDDPRDDGDLDSPFTAPAEVFDY